MTGGLARWLYPTGRRTAIAWLSLAHRKRRLLASTAGVAFAAVLMFVEMGFRNSLLDSQTHTLRALNADLVIVHRQKEALIPLLPFPQRRLEQARSVPDVTAAYPLYVDEYHAVWKSAAPGREHPMLAFGIDPEDPVFLIPEVIGQAAALKELDTALVDSRSRDFYGELRTGVSGELARRRIRIVGTFPLGSDFRVDGNIIVSDRTFANAFGSANPAARRSRVEVGLLRIRADADAGTVQRAVTNALPSDVIVLTKQEFIDFTTRYWNSSKPVGAVFGLGMVIGFLIGVAICYQILYTDISDHLPQYATLKAIGYENRRLVQLVLRKAVYLAILGFVPGLIVSVVAYAILRTSAGITMDLTWPRTLIVLAATLGMCLVSAAIAIRKVVRSDPAELFG
jgi:putative ABC transport system permease protein